MNELNVTFEIISKVIVLSLWTKKEMSSFWKDTWSRFDLPFAKGSIRLIIQYERSKALSVRQEWNDLLLMLVEKIEY